jgi:hypothetical protein
MARESHTTIVLNVENRRYRLHQLNAGVATATFGWDEIAQLTVEEMQKLLGEDATPSQAKNYLTVAMIGSNVGADPFKIPKA